MARTVRDASLETATARRRLNPSTKPYYRSIDHGLHLGYRKPVSGTGKWVARYYLGDQGYKVETIALADDASDADGVTILSFRQAQALVRQRHAERLAAPAKANAGPYTVQNAVDDYLAYKEAARSRSVQDSRYRAEAFILPKLGAIEVSALKTDDLRGWLTDVAATQPRLRTKAGNEQQHREIDGDDAERARRATANRTLTVLKAALNHAWREGKAASDEAWRRVKPLAEADAARVRYLSVDEAKRLVNACPKDFRNLVQAGLFTGCRYGELCRLDVADFSADAATLHIRQSKSGKARHVFLTEEGVALFASLSAGRQSDAPLLPRADGDRWGKAHQVRPIAEACRTAKVVPAISFHILRHTYASLSIMAGAPLMAVARNLGHADTRMCERHYGHLSASYMADVIRSAAPRFGTVATDNVTSIAGKR